MPDIFVSKKPNPSHKSTQEVKLEEAVSETKKELKSQEEVEKIAIIKSNGHKVGMLATFCENPLDIDYDDLDPDERIVLFLRRHFITNIPWIVQGIVLMLLPTLIGIGMSFIGFSFDLLPPNLYIFILLFYYFLVFQFFFLNFLNWFYNISLVTNKKVIDIDFRILFSKNVAATKISQIEDVSLNEVGIIRSVFDYGDVFVQTAGTIDNFEFLAVPHPERVVHIIGDLIGEKE